MAESRGYTVGELARRIKRGDDFTLAMLEEWRRREIVEEQDGLWRLTEQGFNKYGRPILNAEMGVDELAA